MGLRGSYAPRPNPADHDGGSDYVGGALLAVGQYAASVAALLITTEAMVAEMPKKNAGAGGMPAGGGGMGGMGGMDF